MSVCVAFREFTRPSKRKLGFYYINVGCVRFIVALLEVSLLSTTNGPPFSAGSRFDLMIVLRCSPV